MIILNCLLLVLAGYIIGYNHGHRKYIHTKRRIEEIDIPQFMK